MRPGAGGMGEVYRAHDTKLGRDVALKVPSPHIVTAFQYDLSDPTRSAVMRADTVELRGRNTRGRQVCETGPFAAAAIERNRVGAMR